ncbi:MAG TPA: signal peptidase I [Syntrophales bacterium]|jgi:signal peptidase I|nr:signal peptidase I [Syntrophales bacterium]HRT60768.1 signal peptidase I [Syntrophales bacterium]
MNTIKKPSKVKEYAEAIVIAILIAIFIRTFIVQAFKIPSGSMKPTLEIGDHILVNKLSYGVKVPYLRKTLIPTGEPKRGDIVVFIYPVDTTKDFIKRVIAVGGDVVEIKNKKVFVNDTLLADTHAVHNEEVIFPKSIQPRDNFGPVKIPEGTIFVMGDNRDQSYDSRFWGFVRLEDVIGKAFIIYWSWDSDAFSPRWGRMGKMLD